MNPDQLFSIANAWILPAWLLLAAAPRWKFTPYIVVIAGVLPLALCYSILLFSGMGDMSMDTFATLDNISAAFSTKQALLTGWIHYLAFDLFVGFIITYDALRNGIPAVARIPILFFVLMAGPFGWLLYAILRTVLMKKITINLTS